MSFVRKLRDNRDLVQYLYKVPDNLNTDCSYVVVSAANKPEHGICETFVFKADENGAILSYMELPGSAKGLVTSRLVDVDRVFENFCNSCQV